MIIRLTLLICILFINACSNESTSPEDAFRQDSNDKLLAISITPQIEKALVPTKLETITLTFNKDISTVNLTKNQISITPTVNFHLETSSLNSNRSLTLVLDEKLQANTLYNFTIDNIQDISTGETQSFKWSYTTKPNLVIDSPVLQSSTPRNYSTNVSDRLRRIELFFDKDITLSSLSNINIEPTISGRVLVSKNKLIYIISGILSANQNYIFSAKNISDLSGNILKDASISFKTDKDTIPPTTSTLSVAAASKTTSISLTWNASFDLSGIKTYEIKRGSNLQNLEIIKTFSADILKLIDTGLTPETTYMYQLIISDTAGNSQTSNTLKIQTKPLPILIDKAPPIAGSLGLNNSPTKTNITLKWTKATDNVGILKYQINRATNNGAQINIANIDVLPNDKTSSYRYSDNSVSQNTNYTYQIKVIDTSNNSALSNSLLVNTPAPAPASPPPPVPPIVPPTKTLKLSWQTPIQNSDNSCLTNLKLYRLEFKSLNGNYSLLDEVALNSPKLNCQRISTDATCNLDIMNCSYTTQPLTSGVWSFRMQSVNSNNISSSYSNESVVTINFAP